MEEVNNDDIKGKIKFYDDEIDVLLPNNFEEFKLKLGEMLGLNEDFLSKIKLTYKKGDQNDKIEIKNSEDYQNFTKYISENNEILSINVEVKEESNINIKKCSSSILEYKEKKNSGNINIDKKIKVKKSQFRLN